jgi:hypothetical protein
MYIIFNRHNTENGLLRYKEPQDLYMLMLIFKTAQRNLVITGYNIYKFLDFFVLLNTKQKSIKLNISIREKPVNWLFERALLLKQQTYFRYDRLYKS